MKQLPECLVFNEMAKRSCFIGIVASGIFSAMSYFMVHVQKELVLRNRGGVDGVDDWGLLFLAVGFWLGCGALAWHFVFMLFRK